MLSICMIVKNEELNLKSCLSKAAPFADEIIIVDTGSTDDTKAIASDFTDKVYEFVWCDDFSKARNFSISKATNDWILVLDADEYIDEFNREMINRFISNDLNEKKVGRIQRVNIIDDPLGEKKHLERVNRLFNKKYFEYQGIIHEQIKAKHGKYYETENVEIKSLHIGYIKEVVRRTDKINRNIKLLNEALKSNKEDPYLYFQLGKSHYLLRDYLTSANFFKKALSYGLDYNLEYVGELVQSYGYSLVNSERYYEALVLEEYVIYFRNNPDFHFIMGLIYMNNGRFSMAVESFLRCTQFLHSSIYGVTSFYAYYNIAVIYEVLGFKEQAVEYYRKCKDYEPAAKRLKLLLN